MRKRSGYRNGYNPLCGRNNNVHPCFSVKVGAGRGGEEVRDYLNIEILNPKEREHFFAFYTGCLFEEIRYG